ncbi:hypothetical protein [Vreelandella sp. EE7]
MSGGDQASGLRQWASLRNEERAQQAALDETPAKQAGSEHAEPDVDTQATPPASDAATPVVKTPLAVVGLPTKSVAPVKERLGEWAELGRRWAATPESWEVIPVDASEPLEAFCERYSRWALWVRSDADAFASMYRTLRQLNDNQGPRQLLALHEPGLPREGLLDNLQKAAANYLNIELLLLAR